MKTRKPQTKWKAPQLRIDADFIWFRAATACEEELEFNEDLTFIVGSFSEGKRVIEREIRDLKTRFDTNDILLTFTDESNFRKKICPDYKGNRRNRRKPAGYLKLKRWGMETWPSLTMPSLEADDVLGIICTQGDSNFVLVSPDKDMLQIPCRHWNLKEEFTVEPEDAERALYLQALTGDSTDGYPGLAGCGPKKAAAILDKAKEGYWSAVVAAYEKSGFTEEDALKQLRLAKILQSSDWDEGKQEPILFTP